MGRKPLGEAVDQQIDEKWVKEIEAAPKTAEKLSVRLGQALDTDRAELSARLVEICARFVELGLAESARQ